MKKFLSNTIVQLLIAVIIGLSAGFVVNDAVLEAIVCIKHITGQIIFFLVPLIILGFIAPSIAHLRSNASKMLLFAFGIAYLSSIGASFFGAAVGYNVIPFLHIADDANSLKALPENLLKIDIPPVMNVMTALVLAALIGLATAWVKSAEISKLLDTFQKMVLELVKRVLLPVLPVFIAANFCILSYQGAVTKQLPVFLSILIVVIVCHFIWLTLLYFIAAVYSRKNSYQVLRYYGPASILTGTVFVLTVSQMLYGSMPSILQITLFILLLGLFAIGAPGVPGGTVLASLGLIISVLHFDEAGTALLLTIFALQDSFGTACNITGDGALTLITDTFEKK